MGIFGKSAQQKALEAEVEFLEDLLAERSRQLSQARIEKNKYGTLSHEKVKECEALAAALNDIAGMETAGCAHIGRKMATRAREAVAAQSIVGRLWPDSIAAYAEQAPAH